MYITLATSCHYVAYGVHSHVRVYYVILSLRCHVLLISCQITMSCPMYMFLCSFSHNLLMSFFANPSCPGNAMSSATMRYVLHPADYVIIPMIDHHTLILLLIRIISRSQNKTHSHNTRYHNNTAMPLRKITSHYY